MSTKSKTQKRREQRSKNSHPASDRSGKTVGAKNAAISNNQQKALSQLKKQFDDQAVMIRQQQKAISALLPPNADVKTTIDEKYVKVPDAIDTALNQAIEAVGTLNYMRCVTTDDGNSGKKKAEFRYEGKGMDNVEKIKQALIAAKDINQRAAITAAPSGNLKLLKQLTYLKSKGHALTVGHPNVMVQLDGSIKLKSLALKLAVNSTLTSGANAALTTPIAITPGSSNEFSNCGGLFDEYICDGIEHHFRAYTDGATANIAVCNGILVYDPIDNTSYSSIVTAIVGNQKFGPFAITGPSSSAQAAVSRTLAPESVTPTGFWCLKAKMPKEPQESPTVSVEIITGHWDSTIDTGGIYGYIKPYFDAAGAGNTSTMIYWLVMQCRFRSRT